MSAAVEGPTRSLRQEWDPETTPRPTSTSSRQTLVEEADAEYELLRQHESERLERLATTVKAVPATPTDVEDMSLLDELFFGPSTSAASAGGNSPGSPNVAAVFANLPGIETVELERAARRHVDQSIPLLATREQFLRQLGIDTKETIHPDTGCSVMDVDDAHRAYFGHPEDAALAAFLRALVKPIDDPEWLKVSEFADEETAKDCQRIRHAEERRRERSASPPQIDEDLEDCTPVKRQLVQTFRHTHPQSPNRTQTNATLASLVVPLHEVGGESPRWVLDLTTSINPDQQPPLATASNSHDVSPPSTATKYASRTTGLNHEPLPALPLAPPLHGIDSGNNMMGGGLATYPQTSTPLRPTKPSYASSSGPSSHPAPPQQPSSSYLIASDELSPRATTTNSAPRPSNRLRSGREYRQAMRKSFLDRRDRGVLMTPDQLLMMTPQRPNSSRPASSGMSQEEGIQRLLATTPKGRYGEEHLE